MYAETYSNFKLILTHLLVWFNWWNSIYWLTNGWQSFLKSVSLSSDTFQNLSWYLKKSLTIFISLYISLYQWMKGPGIGWVACLIPSNQTAMGSTCIQGLYRVYTEEQCVVQYDRPCPEDEKINTLSPTQLLSQEILTLAICHCVDEGSRSRMWYIVGGGMDIVGGLLGGRSIHEENFSE